MKRPCCEWDKHFWLDGGTSSSNWLVCLNCGRDANEARQEALRRILLERRYEDDSTHPFTLLYP
jgi:hypothetical protein